MTCICKLWMRKLYFTVKEVEILLSWRALKNHSSVHKSIVFYSSIQSMHPFSQLIQLLSAVPITWPCLICNNSLSNGQEQRDYYHSYYSVCCGTLQMWSKKKKTCLSTALSLSRMYPQVTQKRPTSKAAGVSLQCGTLSWPARYRSSWISLQHLCYLHTSGLLMFRLQGTQKKTV